MTFSFCTTGAVNPVIRDFPVEETAKIKEGVIVYLDENGKVSTNAQGNLLGVTAENHSGEKELLNARSCGDRIRVDITSGGVYSLRMPVFTVVSATDDGITVSGGTALKNGAKGNIVLVEKTDGSIGNIGETRKISSVTIDGENAIISPDGNMNISEGDKLMYVPVIGTKGRPDENCNTFAVDVSGSSPVLTVISTDTNAGIVNVFIGGKLFD